MEDLWNLKHTLGRPGAQQQQQQHHQLAAFAQQQQDVDHYNQQQQQQQQQQSPFQEVSVTIRQETVGANLINFGLQASQKDQSNQLSALVQQQQPRRSTGPCQPADLSSLHEQHFHQGLNPLAFATWAPSFCYSNNRTSGDDLFKTVPPNMNYLTQRFGSHQHQGAQVPKRTMQVASFNSTISASGLRVSTITPTGMTVCGELILTETGRLEVVCLCHHHSMPVSKFVQHAGFHSQNPGSVVFLENGDTLVQWRRALFSQRGVNVPDDDVGWDWNDDMPTPIFKHHKAEPEVIDLTRSRQSWDSHTSIAVQPVQPFHSGYLSGMYGVSTQEPVMTRQAKAAAMHNFRPAASTTTASEFDFINRAYCSSFSQQPGVRDKTDPNRSGMQEIGKDNLVSSFELRLGQPSQTAHKAVTLATWRSHIQHGIEYRKALDATSIQATSAGYGQLQNFHGYLGEQKWNITDVRKSKFAGPQTNGSSNQYSSHLFADGRMHPDQDVSILQASQIKTQEQPQLKQYNHHGRHLNEVVADFTQGGSTAQRYMSHGTSQFTWVQRGSGTMLNLSSPATATDISQSKEDEQVFGPGDTAPKGLSGTTNPNATSSCTPEQTPVLLPDHEPQELAIVKTTEAQVVDRSDAGEGPSSSRNTVPLPFVGENETAEPAPIKAYGAEVGDTLAPLAPIPTPDSETNLPSGVCSKSSGNDAGVEADCTKRHDAVDESSGIGKCSSSEHLSADKKVDSSVSGKSSEAINSEIGGNRATKEGGKKKKPLKWKRLNAELSEGIKCHSGVTESHATDYISEENQSTEFLNGPKPRRSTSSRSERVRTRQLSTQTEDQEAVNVEICDNTKLKPAKRPSVMGATKMVSLRSIMKLPCDPQRATRSEQKRTVNSNRDTQEAMEDEEYIPKGTRKRKLSELSSISVARPLELRKRPALPGQRPFKVGPSIVPRGERTPREATKKPSKMWLRSKALHLDCATIPLSKSSQSDDRCNEEVTHVDKFVPRRKRRTKVTDDALENPKQTADQSMHLVESTFYSGPPSEHFSAYPTEESQNAACCVCASGVTEPSNQLVLCCQCPVKVHQACYGVPKVPKGPWTCRACKSNASNIVCVLCGYGGGAMTHAEKTRAVVKGLLKAWSLANRGKSDTTSMQLRRSSRSGETSGGLISNTITEAVRDPNVTQWMHMVCALWMPGTRCLNFATMGMFDVSDVSVARTRLICSICNRQGGSCIQCHESNCAVPFHAWCAHTKGLLQIESVEDGHLRFQGKCPDHVKVSKKSSKNQSERVTRRETRQRA